MFITGRTAYCKRGDSDWWLCVGTDGWMVQDVDGKEADDDTGGVLSCKWAGSLARAPSPLDVPLEAWEVAIGDNGWEQQEGVRVEREATVRACGVGRHPNK